MSKLKRITTPIGSLSYPCALQAPDTKFADAKSPKGDYKAYVRLDKSDPDTIEFLAMLEALWNEGYQQTLAQTGKKEIPLAPEPRPWVDERDRETGELTGNVIIRSKMKAYVQPKAGDGWDQKPAIMQSNGTPYAEVPNIGPGSKAQINAEVNPWIFSNKFGVSLRLKAVMIHSLVEGFGEETAEACGFAVDDSAAKEAGFGPTTQGSDF